VKLHVASDGLKALRMLKGWADAGEDVCEKLLMVFTDAEMPEMDGYRLTTEIRNDAAPAPALCGAAHRCRAASTSPW
jgi:two-component system chemotaxis response regulator CheV